MTHVPYIVSDMPMRHWQLRVYLLVQSQHPIRTSEQWTESKIDRSFVTFLIVNLKMFNTSEYYGLPKCIIAHNLDEEMYFHVKEKQILLGYQFLR